MDTWLWMWLIAAVVFAIIEIATYNLVTIWFAIGAVVAFGLALAGVPLVWQAVAFVGVSTLLLLFTKPFLKKRLKVNKQATNADRVVGQTAIVTNIADSDDELFRVRVLDQIWTAKTVDGSSVELGQELIVTRIQGVKLIVEKKTA